jgi:hypothetical protein
MSEEDSPPFLEVNCKTSGKILRFAPGTDAGFAVALINRKLKGKVPLATHIEAVKDGKEEEEEETIAFGPNAILSNFGLNWKLQTVLSSGKSISTIVEFLFIFCYYYKYSIILVLNFEFLIFFFL